jgi:hypothetical protein
MKEFLFQTSKLGQFNFLSVFTFSLIKYRLNIFFIGGKLK